LATHEIESFLSDSIASFEQRNKRGPSDHWIKNVIVALRSLYKYLNDYGLLSRAPGGRASPRWPRGRRGCDGLGARGSGPRRAARVGAANMGQ
jgi:hypothetical protein